MTEFERQVLDQLSGLKEGQARLATQQESQITKTKELDDYIRTVAETVAYLANLVTEVASESKQYGEKIEALKETSIQRLDKAEMALEVQQQTNSIFRDKIHELEVAKGRVDYLPEYVNKIKAKVDEVVKVQDAILHTVAEFEKLKADVESLKMKSTQLTTAGNIGKWFMQKAFWPIISIVAVLYTAFKELIK